MVGISDLGVGTGPVAVFLLFLQSTGTVHESLFLSISLSYTHTLPYGFIQACMSTASNYHTHRYHSLTEIVKAKSRASYYKRKSRASYYRAKGCNIRLWFWCSLQLPRNKLRVNTVPISQMITVQVTRAKGRLRQRASR